MKAIEKFVPGQTITVRGHIHAIRHMGKVAFIVVRERCGLIQVVVSRPEDLKMVQELSVESAVMVTGELSLNPSNGKQELQLCSLRVLGFPSRSLPVEIAKQTKIDSLSLSAMLEYRPITLRSESQRAVFKLQSEICFAFRQYLRSAEFTEIHSPKIVATGTEGGAELFAVNYFGRTAYLAQSPQFYKQIMVGVFERVYEIGPVYRAEKHNTPRHLNEYLSMDVEMGFIESEQDLIELEEGLLRHIFAHLSQNCPEEIQSLKAKLPMFPAKIPQIELAEARTLLCKEYGWQPESDCLDLDPEGERLLCAHFVKECASEFVFVLKYPSSIRPFYAKASENPGEEGLSNSFDLLFRGLEITTGGQRIHEAKVLEEAIAARGMEVEAFSDYLQCFRYGMPPHGGFAIGLERLTAQLLGFTNLRLCSLFPRDCSRISP